jgi:competence protein ComEC
MRRPLLVLALGYGAGAAASGALPVNAALPLLSLGALSIALAWVARDLRFGGAALLGAAASLGAAGAAVQKAEHRAAPLWAQARAASPLPVRVEGVARDDGRVRDGLASFELEVERLGGSVTRGRMRVSVGGFASASEVIEGDRLDLWAVVRAPSGFVDPGVEDAEARAEREGWHAIAYCKSPRLVERAGHAAGLRSTLGTWRAELRRRLMAFVPPGPEQAVVRAMVLGDRGGLDRETEDAFRVAGTYHVLALSGAQVALVAGILLWLLRGLAFGPGAQAVLVTTFLAAYALLVGGDVPVVRAAVMAGAVLLGRALDLDGDTANLLGLSALALLVARPGDWADVGFQLSYAATLGLVLLTPPIVALAPALPLRLELALATSLAAQLALAPLLVAHFHRLAPAALLLNLLAVPLSTAVLLAGAAVLLASLVSQLLAAWIGLAAWLAARALLLSGGVASGVPFVDARLPDLSWPTIAFHLCALGLLAAGRRRLAAAGLALGWGLAIATRLAGPSGDGALHLTALDVGQADAIVVRSPLGRTLLVDAGGSFDGRLDIGERVLGPYLWSRGISRIDVLVVTHAHPDHVGGVPFLLAAFDVGEVWEGPAPTEDAGYRAMDGALRAARVPRRSLSRGARLTWDHVAIEALGPRGHAPVTRVRNDDSLALLLRFAGSSVLLTGDTESGEASLCPGALSILKVAHHGSRTSTSASFLADARPRVALLSVGSRNPFGHPAPDVLTRLRASGALLFRTDRDGAVEATLDGPRIEIRSASVGPVRVQ